MGHKTDKKSDPLISTNKNASRNYHLEERYEAGVQLTGTEVKSIRAGACQISDAYALPDHRQELWLMNMHVAPYSHGNRFNHDPVRRRKLLLHRKELNKLIAAVIEKGYTLVPTRLYWVKGRVKAEIALAKGKHKGDKRNDLKRRDAQREIDTAVKRRR